MFSSESNYYIKQSQNSSKTYLFYDTVHLMKNIRNKLLNKKRFVFPEFSYDDNLHIKISCPAGYICLGDLYDIYRKGKELNSNLRTAPKLSYLALHPGCNKQNVPLALAVIHEYTKQRLLQLEVFSKGKRYLKIFLKTFNTGWTISNSKKRVSPNVLGNAVVNGDKRLYF